MAGNFRGRLVEKQSREIEKNNSLAREIALNLAEDFRVARLEGTLVKLKGNIAELPVVYAIIFDKWGGYISGLVNCGEKSIKILTGNDSGRTDIAEALKGLLKENPENVFGQLDIIKISFVEKGERGRFYRGGLKLAILLPFNIFERMLIFKIWTICFVCAFIIFGLVVNFILCIRKGAPPIEAVRPDAGGLIEPVVEANVEQERDHSTEPVAGKGPEDSSGVDLLSMEVDRSSRPDTPDSPEDQENGREGWIPMFNGWDLEDWEKEGNWYISNNVVIGSPWQASAVRTDLAFQNYDFRAKVRKIAGRDGFVLIFKCSATCLAWVLGGWNNSRSEVIGVSETVTKTKIERGRWYEVRLSILPEKVEGFLNGKKAWSLPRKTLEKSPSQEDFLSGIGIGVWNTLCKFKDIFILSK